MIITMPMTVMRSDVVVMKMMIRSALAFDLNPEKVRCVIELLWRRRCSGHGSLVLMSGLWNTLRYMATEENTTAYSV